MTSGRTDRDSDANGLRCRDYKEGEDMQVLNTVDVMEESNILCMIMMIAVLFRAAPINAFYAV